MPERDASLATPGDIATALVLLTRLPLPPGSAPRGGAAAWAYPLVGAVIGALAAAAGLIGSALGLPAPLAAAAALLCAVTVTGALHEDGLADSADGLWGGGDRARRLAIMRDSRIGSYGVIALIAALGLRWSALAALLAAGQFAAPVIAAAALSRAMMAAVMHALPTARANGLSARVGRPSRATAALAAGIALAIGVLALGAAIVPVALAVLVAGVAAAAIAKAKIGGQTGDILGATQQMTEIAALVSLAALLP